jgi:uncharacterized protein
MLATATRSSDDGLMDAPLMLAGLALGAAASPHCAAMCGAPCAALTGSCRRSAAGFHLGRVLSYAAGGAAAAASVGLLAEWARAAPVLRPLWVLLHLTLLALGLWWLVTGRQWSRMARGAATPMHFIARRARPVRSALAGLAWVAWPCAATQSALLLAALASSPPGGALVMAAFALASLPGLAVAPWVWSRWQALRGTTVASRTSMATLSFRVAGLGLVAGSGWALGRGVWQSVAAWCGV